MGHETRPLVEKKYRAASYYLAILRDAAISAAAPASRDDESKQRRRSRTNDRRVPDSRLACLPCVERHVVRIPTVCTAKTMDSEIMRRKSANYAQLFQDYTRHFFQIVREFFAPFSPSVYGNLNS